MGQVIHFFLFDKTQTAGLLKPLIYYKPTEDILNAAISIEEMLVDSLLAIPQKHRSRHVAECFDSVLAKIPENAIICDFDVLFNPTYDIDVLETLVLSCKRRNFSAIWPGEYTPGLPNIPGKDKLIYAANGYADYKVYNIADYDITCIV